MERAWRVYGDCFSPQDRGTTLSDDKVVYMRICTLALLDSRQKADY